MVEGNEWGAVTVLEGDDKGQGNRGGRAVLCDAGSESPGMSLVRCTCASWHKKPGGRVPTALVCSLSWDTPKCRAACPPPPGSRQAPVKRIVVPGGPYQYYAVHQYSVVRRVWGPSGVCKFLIFASPTPPQNLIAGILSTHVRCTRVN